MKTVNTTINHTTVTFKKRKGLKGRVASDRYFIDTEGLTLPQLTKFVGGKGAVFEIICHALDNRLLMLQQQQGIAKFEQRCLENDLPWDKNRVSKCEIKLQIKNILTDKSNGQLKDVLELLTQLK